MNVRVIAKASTLICSTCGTEFEHAPTRGGRKYTRCLPCMNAANRAWRAANPETYKAQRDRRPPRLEQQRLRYEKIKSDPVFQKKTRARTYLNDAIKYGKITRKPCEICGFLKTDGHHDDYSKPLDVRWLCRPHHIELHRKFQS